MCVWGGLKRGVAVIDWVVVTEHFQFCSRALPPPLESQEWHMTIASERHMKQGQEINLCVYIPEL